MKAIIVDDEPLARSRMRRLLAAESITVLAECENGEEAIKEIIAQKPDVVFMDINMPKMDGLTAVEVLNELVDELPSIIFCTAYPEHAISAFRKGAANYLLKPISQSDLAEAIGRAKVVTKLQINEMSSLDSSAPMLAVNVDGVIERMPTMNFVYFFLDSRHVFGVLDHGKKILVDYTLSQIEQKYSSKMVRVNRTHIVNVLHIHALNTNNKEIELMIADKLLTVSVSRRQMSVLKETMSSAS